MTANADTKQIERLGNVCAMLTSPNDGERANAALLASRMLSERGLDWREFVWRAFRPEITHREDEASDDESSALRLYRELLKWSGLNDWERSFLRNLLQRKAITLSEKQQTCLDRIVTRYRWEKRHG